MVVAARSMVAPTRALARLVTLVRLVPRRRALVRLARMAALVRPAVAPTLAHVHLVTLERLVLPRRALARLAEIIVLAQ
jgi:hypothetical protein